MKGIVANLVARAHGEHRLPRGLDGEPTEFAVCRPSGVASLGIWRLVAEM